ncbi:MAG: hypothetical protein R2807_10510 [Chitinophagales bacterium]
MKLHLNTYEVENLFENFDETVAKWQLLKTDDDAVFDKEYHFDAADIAPMVTYGTNRRWA